MQVRDRAAGGPKKADAVPAVSSASERSEAGATDAVMREFLAWVARCPRTETDVMEAWRSHCPRYTVWEDALIAQLVSVEREDGMRMGEARVTLTRRGQAVVAGRGGGSD